MRKLISGGSSLVLILRLVFLSFSAANTDLPPSVPAFESTIAFSTLSAFGDVLGTTGGRTGQSRQGRQRLSSANRLNADFGL